MTINQGHAWQVMPQPEDSSLYLRVRCMHCGVQRYKGPRAGDSVISTYTSEALQPCDPILQAVQNELELQEKHT